MSDLGPAMAMKTVKGHTFLDEKAKPKALVEKKAPILEEPEEIPSEPDDNPELDDDDTVRRGKDDNDTYGPGDKRSSGRHVTYYFYLNAAGEPYLRVKRTTTKKFFQYHLENGEWKVGAPKPRIPYRLPELLAAPLSEPVFIAEGEKDAIALAALGLVATTNPEGGRPKTWFPELNLYFKDRTVYVLEDNDPTGQAHATEVATALCGTVASLKIVSFRDLGEHGDVSDFLDQGGTKDELLARAKAGYDPKDRFKFIAFDDIVLNTTPNYRVKDLIPATGIVVVWGPPKCGKSFFIFDLTMHVALGRDYRDLKVRQTGVVYCALEGAEAFKTRATAFRQNKLNGHSGAPFHLMHTPLALVSDHIELITAIQARYENPGIVVIDTVNRSLEGSESSDEDMGAYIKAADAIVRSLGCVVILVHHCGHEGTRPRGHSSLIGNLDTQIAVSRDEESRVIVKVEYNKDGKDGVDGIELMSKLKVVTAGIDDDGDEITSCIVEPAEATPGDNSPKSGPKAKPLVGANRIAFAAMLEVIGEKGTIPEPNSHIPKGLKCAKIEDWKLQAYSRGICSSGEARSRLRAFNRAHSWLLAAGNVGMWEEYIWPSRD